ncbi:hypothetical protein [Hymenobacter weizhouensis]|uniref:hypothetical protein n=1 Tax=Hymenobacter sp. YIM 151500-1 TaxID=2987689 RepID=UPI00222656F8|nr:hypothetical protein [Hymenobacter sp. YIM 151500-1]UYZ64149.1 hypothetical protein OIS53_04710 [Hymenobacter sp. YIM 151500-1]
MANPFGVPEHYVADLVGYSARHELRLLVEVKAGAFWASQDLAAWDEQDWQENFFQELTETWFPDPAKPSAEPATWHNDYYFMLVTPRQIALWRPGAAPRRAPDIIVDASAVLERQLDVQRFPLSRLDERNLESVVYSWLMFSQFKPKQQLIDEPAQRWLVDTGLYEAIYHGDIQLQAA